MKNKATIYMPPMAELLVFTTKDILLASIDDITDDDFSAMK